MKSLSKRTNLIGASVGLAILAAAGALISTTSNNRAKADAAAPPPATPVSVADVKERETAIWDEFSGRLEAIEQVEVR